MFSGWAVLTLGRRHFCSSSDTNTAGRQEFCDSQAAAMELGDFNF